VTEPLVKTRPRSGDSSAPPLPQSSRPPSTPPPPVPKRTPPPVPKRPDRPAPAAPSSQSGAPSSKPPARKPPPPPVPSRAGRPQLTPQGGQQQESEAPEPESEDTEGPEVDTVVGARSTSKRERTYLTGKNGEVTGTSDERSNVSIAGLYGSRKSESFHSDGKSTRSTETEVEGLAGAQAAAKILSVYSDEEISATVELMARAGLFGKAKGKAAASRGALSGSVEGSAEGGMGVQAEGKASARIDRSQLIPAIEAVVHFAVKAGIWGKAEGAIDAQFGPIMAKITGKVEAFVGASAEFDGKVFANWKQGVGAEFAAGARVVATAEAEATSTLSVGGVALQFKGNAVAWAGAEASAEGKLAISLTGITVSGKASAFVGAKSELSGSIGASLRGRTIIKASGKIGVSVGYGAEVEGSFSFSGGNLKISGALAAALHGGVSIGLGAELNFGDLAEIIVEEIYAAYHARENDVDNQPGYERKPLSDPSLAKQKFRSGYNAVHPDLVAYARKLKAQSKPGGVDRDRVQTIIQDHVNHGLAKDVMYLETDQGIRQAVLDAFTGLVKDAVLERGRIAGWAAAPSAEIGGVKSAFQHDEAIRLATDPLMQAFQEYATKKSSKGEHGVKREKIQEIIDKHWKKLKAAYPAPGEADAAVRIAAEFAFAGHVRNFGTTDGKIDDRFEAPEVMATQKKLQAAEGVAEQNRQVVYGRLIAAMQKYKAAVLADPKAGIDVEGMQKAFEPFVKKLPLLSNPGVNKQVVGVISGALAPLLMEENGVTISGGRITAVKPSPGALTKARKEKAASESDAAQQAAMKALETSLAAYVETKTTRGANGIKADEVQKRIDKAMEKVSQWAASGDADHALTLTATRALQPMIHTIDVVNGKITTFDAPQTTAEQVKQFRAENGKARLKEGEEDDNKRRQLVARAVYPGLTAYAKQVRAAAEKAIPDKQPKVVVTKERLQQVIDAGIKKVRADVVNEVGGAEITAQILSAFDADMTIPMIKSVRVEKATVMEVTPNDQLVAQLTAQRNAQQVSSVVRRVIEQLSGEVRAAVTAAASNGRVPTQAELQTLVAKYRPQLSGLDPEEVDDVLTTAVTTGAGDTARAIVVHDGELKRCWLMPRSQVGSGRR
jgi:hypothetical protein